MPTSWGYTYSTKDMLIFAAEGWDWLPARNATGSTTYLVGMKLVGATATPAVIGSFPGRLLNQYSLDVFEGHLRAATNIPTLWQWPTSTAGTEILVPIQVPSSQNQVIILEIPSIGVGGTGMFSEVSRISKLGKDGETFTAVRFFDNVAYAVTFERTDPFYVLDLDVVNPRVLGELEITGFSSYLHSINADNTLILAIGEEAGSDGRVLGLKISLFDSTDPAKPTLVQNYTVEQDQLTWSSSAVTWDFKAFRYLPLTTPEVGILIIPVQVSAPYPSTEGNFDGFIAYDISRQGISERGKIAHIESGRFYGCYSYASLPIRSLVFNGKVTTLKGHSVISTDLDTFVKAWEIQLDDGLAEGGDAPCFYWF
jgi:DNA excision repair protein ERCC-4